MNDKTKFLVAVVDRRIQAQVGVWKGLCDEASALAFPWPIEEFPDHHRPLDPRACMGMLAWGCAPDTARKIPVINLSNGAGPQADCGNLLNDDRAVGRMAARHLLQNQYPEYLALGAGGKAYSDQRMEGFRLEIEARQCPLRIVDLPSPRKPPEVPAGWNTFAYLDRMAEPLIPILRDLPPDAGIFTDDHPAAQSVEHCLYRFFPERIHSTGLLSGDLPVAYRWMPGDRRSISCVRTANEAKGRAALRWFCEHCRNAEAMRQLQQSFAPLGILAKASTAGPACGHPILARGIRWSWGRIQAEQSPSVEELATHLGMSARTLNRLFQSELHQNAREFLLNLRMELAAQTLQQRPELSILNIAQIAGFSNQSAFTAAFRSWSGMTPRDYRAKNTTPPPHTNGVPSP